MGRAEAGSSKAIGNAIKAKGESQGIKRSRLGSSRSCVQAWDD
jgi:hypothetical protein